MSVKKIYRIGCLLSAIGLLLLLILIISGTSYPHILFRIFMPAGFLFLFAGLTVNGIGWILMMREALKNKEYRKAGSVFLTGVFIIMIPIVKMVFFK